MPPAVQNNANNASLQAAAKAEREERLKNALKTFIIRERQRKKEEFEAKVEEERLRKEREARERQNDMTLEETRGQIAKLDQKLNELRNQKQQLFLQLKKVLNEDETRKKQQRDNEMYAMLQAQASLPTPQVFLPPVRVQHHQMPILSKPIGNQPIKRGRSPSPPHQGYYKNSNYVSAKHDDGRRGADYARVLWNKPPTQYQNPGTLFYQTTSTVPPSQTDTRAPTIIYPAYNLPLRQGYHIELQPTGTVSMNKSDPQQKPTQVYHINLDQPPISQSSSNPGGLSQKPQVTMEKINDRYHYAPIIPGMAGVASMAGTAGVAVHPSHVMISGNAAQNQKSGSSLSQGYAPGRGVGSSHEQQMARQQQISVMQNQSTQQETQPPIQYRRLF